MNYPFQEGANINKSLTTLGKVISALAEVVSPRVCLTNSPNFKSELTLSHLSLVPLSEKDLAEEPCNSLAWQHIILLVVKKGSYVSSLQRGLDHGRLVWG